MPEDDVELLADRFINYVDVHPGAARKQNNLLPFLLELQPVQVRIHRIGAFLELLAHVRVDHAHDAVHQDLHLPRNAEQEQRKTPDDNIRIDELFADHRHVVVLHKARTVLAPPATEATATRLDVHSVNENVLGLVVAVLLQPFDKSLRRDESATAFILRACDHYEDFLFFCHARKFRKKFKIRYLEVFETSFKKLPFDPRLYMRLSCMHKLIASVMLFLCAVFAFFAISACGDSVEADEDVATTQEESSSSVKSSSSKAKSSSSSKAKSSSSSAKSSSSSIKASSSSKTNSSSSSTKMSSSSNANGSSSSVKTSSSSKTNSSSSKLEYPDSFKPQDKEYPYAGIPRIVIETRNRIAIKDRETEIPAKMQIWGESSAESEILDLTIRGRGNTSWTDMPKKSYKIEFEKKQSMLGMPKDKDWALIANYADKTLMRNYMSYRLSAELGAYYAPRCEFAELYLNGEYLGVYLLTETIKISENRVSVPEKDKSYIIEVDHKYKKNEIVFFTSRDSLPMRIHNPKDCSGECLRIVTDYMDAFEKFLRAVNANTFGIDQWISLDDYIKHFWVQEFSKNPDAGFYTSVYFIWNENELIRMGPVWDFDIAYGLHQKNYVKKTTDWYTIGSGWNKYLFRNRAFLDEVNAFWREKRSVVESVIDSVGVYRAFLNQSAKNNFKRWRMEDMSSYFYTGEYTTFDEAVDALVLWLRERFTWIDNEISTAGMKQL